MSLGSWEGTLEYGKNSQKFQWSSSKAGKILILKKILKVLVRYFNGFSYDDLDALVPCFGLLLDARIRKLEEALFLVTHQAILIQNFEYSVNNFWEKCQESFPKKFPESFKEIAKECPRILSIKELLKLSYKQTYKLSENDF